MCVGSDPKHVTSDWIQVIYIRLDPRNASDWIQEMHQTGSKKSIPAQSVSGSEPCAGISLRDMSPSCHVAETHANVSWNVTRVTTCHDMSHVRGCLFRWEGLCCHSSWYLLSLTLVIGFVTATSRLYKLTDEPRYHSVHDHIERCESSYYLIQSPDFPFFQFTQSTIII